MAAIRTSQNLTSRKAKESKRMPDMIEPTHHEIAEFLIDERISDMMTYLMEDYGYSIEKAMDLVYRSHTLKQLEKEDAELYVQSSAYVYEMLLEELHLYPVYDSTATTSVAEG